jgi:hypothetical protein
MPARDDLGPVCLKGKEVRFHADENIESRSRRSERVPGTAQSAYADGRGEWAPHPLEMRLTRDVGGRRSEPFAECSV